MAIWRTRECTACGQHDEQPQYRCPRCGHFNAPDLRWIGLIDYRLDAWKQREDRHD